MSADPAVRHPVMFFGSGPHHSVEGPVKDFTPKRLVKSDDPDSPLEENGETAADGSVSEMSDLPPDKPGQNGHSAPDSSAGLEIAAPDDSASAGDLATIGRGPAKD